MADTVERLRDYLDALVAYCEEISIDRIMPHLVKPAKELLAELAAQEEPRQREWLVIQTCEARATIRHRVFAFNREQALARCKEGKADRSDPPELDLDDTRIHRAAWTARPLDEEG